jgi:hypothetical protein
MSPTPCRSWNFSSLMGNSERVLRSICHSLYIALLRLAASTKRTSKNRCRQPQQLWRGSTNFGLTAAYSSEKTSRSTSRISTKSAKVFLHISRNMRECAPSRTTPSSSWYTWLEKKKWFYRDSLAGNHSWSILWCRWKRLWEMINDLLSLIAILCYSQSRRAHQRYKEFSEHFILHCCASIGCGCQKRRIYASCHPGINVLLSSSLHYFSCQFIN